MNKKIILPIILATILSISSVFCVYAVSDEQEQSKQTDVELLYLDENDVPNTILPGEIPAQ